MHKFHYCPHGDICSLKSSRHFFFKKKGDINYCLLSYHHILFLHIPSEVFLQNNQVCPQYMSKVVSISPFYLSCKSDFSIRPLHFFQRWTIISLLTTSPSFQHPFLMNSAWSVSRSFFFCCKCHTWHLEPIFMFCWWYGSRQFSCHVK